MKSCVLALIATGLWAQSQNQTTYTYDINGRRTPVTSTSTTKTNGNTTTTTTVPSVNNGAVPTLGVDQRVVSDGPDGKVIERIVKKYDQNGRPAGTEKVRIEEKKNHDGSTTTRTTIFDSDINGGYMARQRLVANTSVSGNTVRTETQVEAPSPNGGFDLSEKRLSVAQGDDQNSKKDLTVYRKDANGRFLEAVREITQLQTQNGQKVTMTTEYNAASTGKMELSGQKVSTVVKQPNGSELTVTDVYGQTATAQYSGGKPEPQLREQQIIEKKPGPGGVVVETFSVRRPALDTKRLGPAKVISETVCTGNCLPPQQTASAPPAPPQQVQTAPPPPPPQP